MDDQDLISEQSEDFEKQWSEWIASQPHFTQKGEPFVQSFKLICKSWYLRGIKAGVLCGAVLMSEPE
jgi:hypothetical protein